MTTLDELQALLVARGYTQTWGGEAQGRGMYDARDWWFHTEPIPHNVCLPTRRDPTGLILRCDGAIPTPGSPTFREHRAETPDEMLVLLTTLALTGDPAL